MDNVYQKRVEGIRERVGNLSDRIGLTSSYYARADFAMWLVSQKQHDAVVLDHVARWTSPTPPDPAPQEVPDGEP